MPLAKIFQIPRFVIILLLISFQVAILSFISINRSLAVSSQKDHHIDSTIVEGQTNRSLSMGPFKIPNPAPLNPVYQTKSTIDTQLESYSRLVQNTTVISSSPTTPSTKSSVTSSTTTTTNCDLFIWIYSPRCRLPSEITDRIVRVIEDNGGVFGYAQVDDEWRCYQWHYVKTSPTQMELVWLERPLYNEYCEGWLLGSGRTTANESAPPITTNLERPSTSTTTTLSTTTITANSQTPTTTTDTTTAETSTGCTYGEDENCYGYSESYHRKWPIIKPAGLYESTRYSDGIYGKAKVSWDLLWDPTNRTWQSCEIQYHGPILTNKGRSKSSQTLHVTEPFPQDIETCNHIQSFPPPKREISWRPSPPEYIPIPPEIEEKIIPIPTAERTQPRELGYATLNNQPVCFNTHNYYGWYYWTRADTRFHKTNYCEGWLLGKGLITSSESNPTNPPTTSTPTNIPNPTIDQTSNTTTPTPNSATTTPTPTTATTVSSIGNSAASCDPLSDSMNCYTTTTTAWYCDLILFYSPRCGLPSEITDRIVRVIEDNGGVFGYAQVDDEWRCYQWHYVKTSPTQMELVWLERPLYNEYCEGWLLGSGRTTANESAPPITTNLERPSTSTTTTLSTTTITANSQTPTTTTDTTTAETSTGCTYGEDENCYGYSESYHRKWPIIKPAGLYESTRYSDGIYGKAKVSWDLLWDPTNRTWQSCEIQYHGPILTNKGRSKSSQTLHVTEPFPQDIETCNHIQSFPPPKREISWRPSPPEYIPIPPEIEEKIIPIPTAERTQPRELGYATLNNQPVCFNTHNYYGWYYWTRADTRFHKTNYCEGWLLGKGLITSSESNPTTPPTTSTPTNIPNPTIDQTSNTTTPTPNSATTTPTPTTATTVNLVPSFSGVSVDDQIWRIGDIVMLTLPYAVGGNSLLSYEISPRLPVGLVLDGSLVSGSPTEEIIATEYTWTATDADGDRVSLSFNITITVDLEPTFGANTISDQVWTQNRPVNLTLPTATGGDSPIAYDLSPALPSGLYHTGNTIAGTPTEPLPETTFTWTASDTDGDQTSLTFMITVDADTAPSFGTQTISDLRWDHDQPVTHVLPTASNGNGTLSYTLTPVLPEGLTLTGYTISGATSNTPSLSQHLWTVTDQDGDTAHLEFEIRVGNIPTGTDFTQRWRVGDDIWILFGGSEDNQDGWTYRFQPLNFANQPDPNQSLPSFLTNEINRILYGTPTAADLPPNTVNAGRIRWTATNPQGQIQATQTLTWSLHHDLKPTFPQPTQTYILTHGEPINITLPQARGGDQPLTYQLTPRQLPRGLQIDHNLQHNTYQLTGTSTQYVLTPQTYTWTATDSDQYQNRDTTSTKIRIQVVPDRTPYFTPHQDPHNTLTIGQTYTNHPLQPQTQSGNQQQGTQTYQISPPLPTGLTLNQQNGTITGTPTGSPQTTTHTWTYTDSDNTHPETIQTTITITLHLTQAPVPQVTVQTSSSSTTIGTNTATTMMTTLSTISSTNTTVSTSTETTATTNTSVVVSDWIPPSSPRPLGWFSGCFNYPGRCEDVYVYFFVHQPSETCWYQEKGRNGVWDDEATELLQYNDHKYSELYNQAWGNCQYSIYSKRTPPPTTGEIWEDHGYTDLEGNRVEGIREKHKADYFATSTTSSTSHSTTTSASPTTNSTLTTSILTTSTLTTSTNTLPIHPTITTPTTVPRSIPRSTTSSSTSSTTSSSNISANTNTLFTTSTTNITAPQVTDTTILVTSASQDPVSVSAVTSEPKSQQQPKPSSTTSPTTVTSTTNTLSHKRFETSSTTINSAIVEQTVPTTTISISEKLQQQTPKTVTSTTLSTTPVENNVDIAVTQNSTTTVITIQLSEAIYHMNIRPPSRIGETVREVQEITTAEAKQLITLRNNVTTFQENDIPETVENNSINQDPSASSIFVDISNTPHRKDIEQLAQMGITQGCSSHLHDDQVQDANASSKSISAENQPNSGTQTQTPIYNKHYCPDRAVTRAEIATLLTRALNLPPTNTDHFTDDNTNTHQQNINRLAQAGITQGCASYLRDEQPEQHTTSKQTPPEFHPEPGDTETTSNTYYCPNRPITRAEIATLLTRALNLPPTNTDHFTDDNTNTHQQNINRLATAQLTQGCNPPQNTKYCPNRPITRAEIATLLTRALNLTTLTQTDS